MTPSARVQRQIDALLDQAEAAIRERDWNAALECIRAVLNVDPTNEDALSFKGMAESARGDAPISGISDAEQLATLREEAASPDTTPTSFANGRYEVTGFLGEGGKKKVYLVHDTTLDRDVAFGLIKAEGLDEVTCPK